MEPKREKEFIGQPVMLESPYNGDIEKNVQYAWECMCHSYFVKGEAPVAPHLLWTRLSEEEGGVSYIPDTEKRRETALLKCKSLRKKLGVVIFYMDLGESLGMQRARKEALEDELIIIDRYIY